MACSEEHPALKLQAEVCWRYIFKHLDSAQLTSVQLTCKHFASVMDDDAEWKGWLVVGSALLGGTERLASGVLGASSVDQDVEDPSNVLKWSQCTPDVRDGAQPHHAAFDREHMHLSCRCNPATMNKYRPCYWSSLPTDDENTSEWIWIKLRSMVCLVSHLSIYPYEAYWQPPGQDGRYPIYSPKHTDLTFGIFATSEGEEDDVWASTARWKVPHDTQGVAVQLQRPLLVLGGQARVNLVGRRQRQTYEQLGEFYTCIQHLSMSGARVKGVACRHGGGSGGGWALERTEERQCGMCGSFKGGAGEHGVPKLVKCGWCKQEWYCGKECQREHWKIEHKDSCSGRDRACGAEG